MTSADLFDPDGQMPLPFQAAVDYAATVMTWAQEPLPPEVVAVPDQPYGADRLQRYDAYAPRGAVRAPVLVFWHGGGWTNGYRAFVRFMAPHVTRMGLVLVAPSYRLAPAHRLPAAADDCLALLRVLGERLGALGGDAQRLYLAGHSAGGHLAALTALRRDRWPLHGLGDGAIRACLPISGIMDLAHPAPPGGSLEERVYTMVLQEAAHDVLLSPLYWSAGNRVPLALSFGAGDSQRVLRSNRRLHVLLAAQGAPVRCDMRTGHDHFQTHTGLRQADHPWYRDLQQLVEETA